MSAQAQAIQIASRENKITVTQEQLSLARQTVARELDDNEFGLFCYNCQRLGVHPLDGMVVPIKRTDNDRGEKRLTFVITVDLLRSRAAESGEYAGSDDAIFEYEMKDSMPSDARVTVWRFVQGEKCSFTATARWEEYYPGEKQGFMWRSKPHVMLSKCAEALALRKGFPKQLQGLYIPEELQRETESARQPVKAQQKKIPPKQSGDVMCNECRAINGHLPSCSYRSKGPAEAASKADKQGKPEELKWLVAVEAVDEREGQGRKYLMLTCYNAANQNVTLYCWHTGETATRLRAIKKGTKCIFVVKAQASGDKTYYQIESIVEITGEKKPEQPELLPPDEKF